jgi:pyruvate/2-oxoglutarate dehydrogenase complex dihydrolipoamide dehydrogenase (E3) component
LAKHQQKALIEGVVDGNSDRILGIHMAGENTAEIV